MGWDGAKGCRRWAAAARPGGRVATEEIELRLSHEHSAHLILLPLAQIIKGSRVLVTSHVQNASAHRAHLIF